jgi:hypothetical protein
MRRGLPAALTAILIAGGCAPGKMDTTTGAVETTTAPANTQDSTSTPPPGAAGKISAEQVGKVSPVPAFQGGGADWSIEILAVGDMRHSVKLIAGDDVQTGTAVYQPTTDGRSQIQLTGTLYAAPGDRALRIILVRGECRDAAGRSHLHQVRVDIAGAASLRGCGDLAMY